MATHQTRSNSKTKYLLGLIVLTTLLLSGVAGVAFSLTDNDGFDLARQEILLRKIGHEVLNYSGDSTSRVLPVKKIGKNAYQIRFENEFTFQTDSLVKIVERSLAEDHLATGYIVNVRNCSGLDVVFGYAMSGNEKNDIVPCSGRKQPKDCYLIEVQFESSKISASQKGYLIGGIPLLAFVGLLISRSVRNRRKTDKVQEIGDEQLNIGGTLFDPKNRNLLFEGNTIELTAKENKLLLIFARSPNTIIERGRLQKEIWEDEGVIVGRSLDMFISKLRKKLEGDLSIQLINIHSKGYKLEISV
jgi:DNA-binding winged helix-turn-helix (wHTH) protein